MEPVAERWTRERRLEHTRGVLLDAAEEVFVKRGFGGAALEDIAEAAGYTRGAIYSHFGAKEELFLAVVERHLLRFLNGFEDVIGSFESFEDLDVAQFAERWRELTIAEPDSAALGYEFSLFLLRNPGARERLAAQREETVRLAGRLHQHPYRAPGRHTDDPRRGSGACSDCQPRRCHHQRAPGWGGSLRAVLAVGDVQRDAQGLLRSSAREPGEPVENRFPAISTKFAVVRAV